METGDVIGYNLFMSWIAFALLSVLLYSVATLLQRVLMKEEESDAFAYSIAFQILGAVVVGIFAVSQGFVFPPLGEYWFNFFVLLPLLNGAGTLCMFSALKYAEASEVTIISSVRGIVTIVSAVLLLGEVFDLQKAAGAVLIILSVILVTERVGKIRLSKGILFAFGMAFFYGLAITNDAFLLRYSNVYSYSTIGFLLPGLFLILVNPKKVVKLKTFLIPKTFLKMLLMIGFYGSAALLFFTALNSGANASQATPILDARIIVTVILAAIFLNERDRLWKKILGAVLVTIGVLLLA